MHRRDFLSLLGATSIAQAVWASSTADPPFAELVDHAVTDGLTLTHVPGLAVARVQGNASLLTEGYGYADLESKRRVTADTAFYVASVGKIVTALAIMMLWERKAFSLDAPVGVHLDFPLSHPRYPESPITFRQLLTHTSGLSDERLFSIDPTAAPSELRELLISYLTPSGKLYDPGKCFAGKPGQAWAYCNIGYALLGYLVGRLGPEPLDSFSKRRVFAPLGMKNTAWRYEGLREEQVATGYNYTDGKFQALPRASYPDWPDGLLVTSANDFARLLSVFTGKRANILKPGTAALMLEPDPVTVDEHDPLVKQGLMWELHSSNGITLATKSGKDSGANAMVVIDPMRHTGALVFMNVTSHPGIDAFQESLTRLIMK